MEGAGISYRGICGLSPTHTWPVRLFTLIVHVPPIRNGRPKGARMICGDQCTEAEYFSKHIWKYHDGDHD